MNVFGNCGDQVEPSFGEEAGNPSSVAQSDLPPRDLLEDGLGIGLQFFRLHEADTESESSVVLGEAGANKKDEACRSGVRGKPVQVLKLGA